MIEIPPQGLTVRDGDAGVELMLERTNGRVVITAYAAGELAGMMFVGRPENGRTTFTIFDNDGRSLMGVVDTATGPTGIVSGPDQEPQGTVCFSPEGDRRPVAAVFGDEQTPLAGISVDGEGNPVPVLLGNGQVRQVGKLPNAVLN